METTLYNQEGKEAGKLTLPKDIFGLPWNADLVHQVVVSMMSNAREAVAHTKDRGEVRGGGKKPWRQKGTGRARHGSSRSPIWVGGGVTHGPRNDKDYSRKVNRKMKAKALFTILSKKFKDGEVVLVDSMSMEGPKTKLGRDMLGRISDASGTGLVSKRKNAAYIALSDRNEAVEKSMRNFGNVEVDTVRNMNPLSLMQYKYVVIENPEQSLKFLAGKMEKKASAEGKAPAKRAKKQAK